MGKYTIAFDTSAGCDMPDNSSRISCNTLEEAQKILVELVKDCMWGKSYNRGNGIITGIDEWAEVIFAPDGTPVVGFCGKKYQKEGIYRYYCWSIDDPSCIDLRYRHYLCVWLITNSETGKTEYKGHKYYMFGDEAAARKWAWRKSYSLEQKRKEADQKYEFHHNVIVIVRWNNKEIHMVR